MIALITAAIQLTLAILSEIFSAAADAKKKQQAVDASNEAFQAIVVKVLNKVGSGKYTITRTEDDAVDAELRKSQGPKT